VVTCEVRQSGAGRPRSDLSLEKKEDLEKRLESMSGCLTNRPRKTSALSKGNTLKTIPVQLTFLYILREYFAPHCSGYFLMSMFHNLSLLVTHLIYLITLISAASKAMTQPSLLPSSLYLPLPPPLPPFFPSSSSLPFLPSLGNRTP